MGEETVEEVVEGVVDEVEEEEETLMTEDMDPS